MSRDTQDVCRPKNNCYQESLHTNGPIKTFGAQSGSGALTQREETQGKHRELMLRRPDCGGQDGPLRPHAPVPSRSSIKKWSLMKCLLGMKIANELKGSVPDLFLSHDQPVCSFLRPSRSLAMRAKDRAG